MPKILKIDTNTCTPFLIKNKNEKYRLEIDQWHGWRGYGCILPQCRIIKLKPANNGKIQARTLGYCTLKDGSIIEFTRKKGFIK